MTDLAKLGLTVDSDGFVRATDAMNDYEAASKKVGTTSDRLVQKLDALANETERLGNSLSIRLTAPLLALSTKGVLAFSSFDQAMTQSLSIMGEVSAMQETRMVEAARTMGRETVFSAKQAADSYYFLASAGLDAEQSIAALPQVAAFAQAGMFDMATATDLATDAQSALGLTAQDAEQNLQNLAGVTDVLVGASTLANASVRQFSESLTAKAGSAIKQLNIDLETGVAVLAAWADQGVKGAQAGERFNIVTRDLQSAIRKNADEFERLGIEVFDSEGNFNNLIAIIEQLEGQLGSMSVEQQGATLAMLGFQDESVQAIRSLIGLSGNMRKYEEALKDVGGLTQEIADKQLQSFSNQMALTRGVITDVFITLGEGLAPVLLDFNTNILPGVIEKIEGWVTAFRDADIETQRLVIAIGAMAAALGPLLLVFSTFVGAVSNVLPLIVTLGKVIGVAGAAMAGIGVLITGAAMSIERDLVPGMEKVSVMDQAVNVLTRAWVILREVVLGVGEVIVGLGVTALGAFEVIIAPIEGIVTSASAAIEKLINGDLKGARDAISGISEEITRASLEGQARIESGVGFMAESISTRVQNAITEVNELQAEMIETAAAAEDIGDGADAGFDAFNGMVGRGVEIMKTFATAMSEADGVTKTFGETTGGVVEGVEEFESKLQDQIKQLRIQKLEIEGGTRAVLEFELAQLRAAGASDEVVARLQRQIDEIVTAEDELRSLQNQTDEYGGSINNLNSDMDSHIAMYRQWQDEMKATEVHMASMAAIGERALGDLSASFSQFMTGEISSMKDFVGEVNTILEQGLSDSVNQVMNRAIEGGLSSLSGGDWATLGAGIVSGIGQMIGGRTGGAVSGLAQGALMGSMVGGPIGGIIGGILGGVAGFFGTEKDPRLEVGGVQNMRRDPNMLRAQGNSVETALGETFFRFRGIEDAARKQMMDGLKEFDQTVANMIDDPNQLGRIRTALENMNYYATGDNINFEDVIRIRLEAVVHSFEDFERGLIESEKGIENQMQIISDILNIQEVFPDLAGFSELGDEEFLSTINAMREGTETLGQAFQRIIGAFETYAASAASIQNELATSQLNSFQREMVNIQIESMRARDALNAQAQAAGFGAARAEDLANVHERTAQRMAAVIGQMEEAARGLVADLFGTELTRLQDEIEQMRADGAGDEDIAERLERVAQLEAEEAQRQRALQGQELAQLVADISQASGESFDAVAERLGFGLGQLAEVLGLEEQGLISQLEAMQVDPMELATEIQNQTTEIVTALVGLPGKFATEYQNVLDGNPTGGAQTPDAGGVTPGDGRGAGTGSGRGEEFERVETTIKSSIGETTTEVSGLRGDVSTGLAAIAESDRAVANALNNLSQALRSRADADRTRSTRTRARIEE